MRIKGPLIWAIYILSILTAGCGALLKVTKLSTLDVKDQTLTAENIQIDEPSKSLSIGEKLTYDVSWLGIEVGEITTTIKGIEDINERKAYRIELEAKTNRFCSAFYPVKSIYTSYMDTQDLVSLRHEVKRREGKFKKLASTNFDQRNNKAYFKNFFDNSEKSFTIPPDVQDTLTAIYHFRTRSVKLGDRVDYEVVANEKIYSLYSLIEKSEFIRIRDVGTFKSFLIQPSLKSEHSEDERASKTKLTCYFSADSSRIPLVGIFKGPIFTKVTVSLSKLEYIKQDEK